MKKLSILVATCALLGLCACGSEATEPATADPAPAPAAEAPAPAAEAAPAAAAAPAGGGGAVMTLTTGFAPDPSTASGTSGGTTEAATMNDECAGWVSASADHVLELGAAFPMLRIMAHGTEEDSDVTLVVRRPDGTFLCNDDSEGFDPMVEGEFAAGRYDIFVGSYEEGAHQAYVLGVSASATATPSALTQ